MIMLLYSSVEEILLSSSADEEIRRYFPSIYGRCSKMRKMQTYCFFSIWVIRIFDF